MVSGYPMLDVRWSARSQTLKPKIQPVNTKAAGGTQSI
jgi:hypothetical protein